MLPTLFPAIWDTVLCIPGWLQTLYVAKDGLEHLNLNFVSSFLFLPSADGLCGAGDPAQGFIPTMQVLWNERHPHPTHPFKTHL